jgi:hypothetical protein
MNRQHPIAKIFLVTLCIAGVVLSCVGFRLPSPTIALITKIIPEVSKKSVSTDWGKATKGEMLVSGDQVRTEKSSLAIIKFLDNSIVRVRELSDLTINGEVNGGKFTKSVRLGGGAVGFEVRKQIDEQFRLTSPTSVASIRGTKGKWSGGHGNDTLVVIEGLVNLRNLNSNKDVDVGEGNIGFSNEDGSVTSRQATAEELADAGNAVTTGSTNELKLEFKDPQGNKKQLKLKYK